MSGFPYLMTPPAWLYWEKSVKVNSQCLRGQQVEEENMYILYKNESTLLKKEDWTFSGVHLNRARERYSNKWQVYIQFPSLSIIIYLKAVTFYHSGLSVDSAIGAFPQGAWQFRTDQIFLEVIITILSTVWKLSNCKLSAAHKTNILNFFYVNKAKTGLKK